MQRLKVGHLTRKLRKYRMLNSSFWLDRLTNEYYSDIPRSIRRATHAGSWYPADSSDLAQTIEQSLHAAHVQKPMAKIKAIIAPHAGYEYSLHVAAQAYAHIKMADYKRVMLLGPSHKAGINYCALSKCHTYETPLGNIQIDTETVKNLQKATGFHYMALRQDEDEHSLEMHLPLLKHLMGELPILLVPIMVGQLTQKQEEQYGKVLAGYISDKETLFVISSDFCHWGMDYNYLYYRKEDGAIHKCIAALDNRGIQLIEALDPAGFHNYLQETGNTICGQHPITVLLNAIKESNEACNVRFVAYEQSSKVIHPSQSSVSYAAAYITANADS